MINKQVLRSIQSAKQKEWYATVTDAALYMATGGFLKEGNDLLQAIWKYNLDHDSTTWLGDNAFEVLWYAANERPAFVPFEKIDIDQLELDFRQYCTMANSLTTEDVLQSLAGIDLSELEIEKADLTNIKLPATNGHPSLPAAIRNNKMPDSLMELESLALLEKYLAENEWMANHEFCNTVSLAAELAAKNNNTDLAIKLLKIWASGYHERYLGYSFSKAANSRHLAPLLLQGIIAKELDLTKEKCTRFIAAAIAAIDERMKSGDPLVYGKLSWTALIKKLSGLSIKYDPALFDEKQKTEDWIGQKAATKNAIALTEKRLGLKLPGDYKDFLLVSNGLPGFPIVNPALVKIEEVDFLRNLYSIFKQEDIFEIIKGYPDEIEGTIERYVEHAVCISQFDDEQEIWLIPPSKKNKTWQTWFFAAWIPGENRYKSFRHFIEEQIQQLEND